MPRLVIFHPRVREIVRGYPDEVRKELGRILFYLQCGHMVTMPLVRAMPAIGRGVTEIRLRAAEGVFRVFYLITGTNSILVFHAFKKKTQKTPHLEIELARKRLKELG